MPSSAGAAFLITSHHMRASPFSSRCLLLAALTTQFCLIGRLADATSFTWDGGGADDRFDTTQNWSADVAPVSGSSTDLHFAGTLRLTPSNTFGAGSDLGSIIFDAGAGASNVRGNAVNL